MLTLPDCGTNIRLHTSYIHRIVSTDKNNIGSLAETLFTVGPQRNNKNESVMKGFMALYIYDRFLFLFSSALYCGIYATTV